MYKYIHVYRPQLSPHILTRIKYMYMYVQKISLLRYLLVSYPDVHKDDYFWHVPAACRRQYYRIIQIRGVGRCFAVGGPRFNMCTRAKMKHLINIHKVANIHGWSS